MATAEELWEQIKNGNGGKKQTVQTLADTGEASDKAKQIWQQIKGESSGKKQIVSSAPAEEEPSEEAKRIWTLIKRQSAGEAWSSSPRVMAQKARQDYENYISSDEYKQARQSAMQRYNAEHKWDGLLNAMNPMAGGSTLPSAAQIREMEDPKEQELKALAEYYEAQADAWDNEQIMKRDMAEFASWPEEDRAALESYIATKNQEFGNIYADPLYSKTELSVADLYRKYGAGKVREMVESYTRYHNQKNAEAVRNFATEQTKDSVGGSILHSAGSWAANALGNYTGPLGLAQELSGRTGRYSTLDPNNLGGIPGQYSGTVLEQVVQNIAGENEGFDWRDVAALGYQGTMSAGDNLIRAGLGGGSKVASLGLAAAGSFGQTVQQASAQGATPAQALGLATANSIFEVTTEYIPLDELLKQAKGSPHAVGAIVKNILLQSGIEATTEEINLICSTLAEAAILQDKSAYNQQIARLVAEGASYGEAKAQADRDLVIEAVETAVTSAISGGMSTGTAAAQHRVQATQTGKALYQMAASRDGIQGAIERGFESGAGTEAYKIAEKVAKQYFSGEKVSSRDLNALYRATEVLGQKEIQALIDTGLESAPETDAHRIAESLRKQYYSGKKLSNYDLGALYLANVQAIAEEAKAERKAAAQAKEEAQKQEAAGIDGPVATQNGQNVPQNGQNVPVAAQNETTPAQAEAAVSLAQQLRQENENNGGIQNVEGYERIEGPAAAQPGGVQTAAGAGVLHGGSQRYDGQSAREQAGSMAGGAGPAAQGRRPAIEQFRTRNQRKDLGKNLRLERVSSLSLGITNGTERPSVQVIPQENWDDSMQRKAEQIYEETGKKVTYVLGGIEARGVSGAVFTAKGVITEDGIIVQADHVRYSAEQIADHEAYHGMKDLYKQQLDNALVEQIKETFTREEFDKVLDKYILALRDVIDVAGAETGEEYEQRVQAVIEELLADAHAGMNMWGAGATQFTETVNAYLDDNYISRKPVQENGVRQTNGPPSSERYSADDSLGNMRSLNITRRYIHYKDTVSENRVENEIIESLLNRGKVVEINDKTLDTINETNWNDYKGARNCIRKILEKFLGITVHFSHGNQKASAYLTRNGIKHAVAGSNTKEKAEALNEFVKLVHTSEYAYSSTNDTHNDENDAIEGAKDWDCFISLAKIGKNYVPIIFKIRTIDTDIRSQIYSIATKNETSYSRGDVQQNNLQDTHPNSYGESPVSGNKLSQKNAGVKENRAENENLSDGEFREQYGLKLPALEEDAAPEGTERFSADDSRSYAEIEEQRQELYRRENKLRERKRAAESTPELLQAMDEYSNLFTEMRGLLPKRRNGTATQAELDRIEEIKTLRDEYMQRIVDLQESLGLAAISQEETEIREKKEELRVASDAAWTREGAERENLAIEKAGVSPSEYFRRKAIKAFKTTTNFNEAGYLLPDGKLLNFSGGERNHRYRDHREIGEIYEATNGVAALNRFLADGNIRIMAESPGADLPAGVEPTREQYAALRKFINSNGVQDRRFYVDFSNADGSRAGNYAYEGRIYADRVINDIKHYYATGETVQRMDLNQFRYSVDDTEEQRSAARKATKPVAESKPIIAKRDLQNTVLNLFSIPSGQRGELGSMIDSYAERLIKNGSLTEEDRKHFFDRMYESGVMTVPADDYYALGRSYIKEGRIYVPDSVIADIGDDWNDFRRRAFAAGVYLVNDRSASGIDQWNTTLSAEDMLPGLFDSEETDQRSILERIVQVAEEGRDEKMSLLEYTARLAEREGQSEDEFLDNMERQLDWALRTFAEKAKLEIKLRDRTGVAVAKEKERGNQRRMREFYRDLQRQEKERQARKEAAQRQRDRKALQEMQKKTLKQLQWLSKNRYRAPEELKDAWDEVLGDIDIYAVSAANEMRWSDKYNATWQDIVTMYDKAKAEDPNAFEINELERMAIRLRGKKIGDLDVDALNDLYRLAIGLRTLFYNRKNVLSDERRRLFAEVYSDSVKEIMSAPKSGNGTIVDKVLNWAQLTPMNLMQRMGGWDPNGTFYSMAKQLEKGERDVRAYTVKAKRMLQEFLTEHEDWVKKADGQGKDGIWYEVEIPELLALRLGEKPVFGETIKVWMTPAQKVHMYLESKNQDNLRHMTGGRCFVNKELYSHGKRQEAFGKGTKVRLAPETVRAIVSDLTPEEMELAQILDRYYNAFATQEINRVSNILYGYDKAMGKNYAPIYVNKSYTQKEFGVFDVTVEGIGNLKERQKYSKNPSYNISAFDAFERHVDKTAGFCGMAIPIRNWTSLMNWQAENDSMGAVLEREWNGEANKYIDDMITTLQGGNIYKTDIVSSGLSKLQNNYISAIFGANPSIVLKQLGSIPMAGAYLGNRNAPTIAQVAHIDRDFIAKYSQDLAWRTMGYSMPETKQLKDNPNWTQTNRFFRFTFGGGAITAMDGWAASVLWPWAENKVRREFPELEMGTQEQIENGESPFYRKVAEEFEEALARSQSTTDETHQSSLRKSKNPVTRAFTMFRSDSAQTYNAIRQKIGEAQYYARTGASPEVLRAVKKGAGATVLALLANAAWSEAISFLMALWKNKGKNYRDDEEELTFESVAGTMVQNMAGSVAGTVTFGDELAELIGSVLMGDKWYGIETSGMEQLNDVIDVIYSAGTGMKDLIAEAADVVKNGGDLGAFLSGNSGEILNHIKELSETAAMYFVGLPASNVEAYLLGIVKWVSPELATAYEDVFASTGKSDLSGLDGDALIARAGNVLENRGINVSDDTVQALTDLYAAGYKKAFPSDVPSSVSVDGESRKLGAYQQQTYDKVWSGTVADALDDIVSSDDFSRMDQQGQEKVLSNLYTYAADLAKSEVFDDYEIGSYTERVQDLQREDMSLADAIILSSKMDSSAVKDYLEMTGAGMDADTADTVISEIEDLEPIEGAESVSDVQRWRVVIDSSRDDEQRMVGLFATMTEAQYTKAEIAYDMGVSPDAYVTLQEIKTQYDADGNGSFKNSEIQAAIDSMDMQLTNAQKAVLWQLATGSTSTKGNPYDKNVGQQVIDAREAAKTRSAASEEDEALTAEEALMRQLMGLG